MAQAFNLTAQLNLRGPSNVRQIVSDIKKQLGTISGDVNIKIDPAAINNTSKLNRSLQVLNTNLANVASNASAASNAIKNFGQSVSNVGNASTKLSNNLSKAAKSTDSLGTSASKSAKSVTIARTEMEEFGRQSALAVRRFAAFSAVTGVFFSLNRAINSGLKSFIDFDKELVRLQQVTGKSAEGLKGLQDEIVRLSTGLGVSSDSLIKVSSTLAQAGLSATETRAALEALARSSLAPSFDDINQTVEGSIALMRQFGISAKELEKALGSVNAVAAAFAVESGDIIAAIQRTGGVFASASKGVSEGTDALNEFIAVFTSVRATTRESAETIATGLRTIFTRIQRQGTIEALREYGVSLTDVEGKFVGAYKAVQLLSEGLNRIDPRDVRFSQIVEELGGFRQIGKVIPLIQQFATAQEALKVAQAGQGSLAADAVKAQLSLANQISKVREEFLALIRSLGQSDTFQTLARGALGFASGLIKITSALKGVLPALAILGAGASLRGITQFAGGFIGGLKKVPKGGQGSGGQNPSIAQSIGANLGSSLVGAKTEQVSRDLDQNSASLDKVSGKLDVLSSAISSLAKSIESPSPSIDPVLFTNLTSSINNLNSNFSSINNILSSYSTLLQDNTNVLSGNSSALNNVYSGLVNLEATINSKDFGGGPTTARDGGRILGFARGGSVPGSGKGDKVPALLEPGEVVMSNRAVKQYGRGNLVRMNRYAGGKKVKRGIIDDKYTEATDIVDGDTIGGNVYTNMTFRFAGIDAPEVGESFSDTATKSLASRGLSVLTKSIKKTSGGKGRGLFANDSIATDMVSKGLAVPGSSESGKTIYGKKYVNIAEKAKVKGLGLWSVPNHPKALLYNKNYNKKNIGGIIQKFGDGGEALQSKLSTIRTLLGDFYGNNEDLISKSISNSMIIDEARADKIIANLESSRSQLPLFQKLLSEKSSSVGVLNGFPVARYDAIGGVQTMRFDELKDEQTIREFIKRGKLATQASRGPVGKRIVYSDQKSARRRFEDGGIIQKYAEGGEPTIQKGVQSSGVGIFDSDMVAGGTNIKKELLQSLLGSGKPYSVISGPAGSGKTTFATGRFGRNFVLSSQDLEKYERFVVLSGAGATKAGNFSPETDKLLSGAQDIIVLSPDEQRLMQQRQGRLDSATTSGSPDQRSIGALKGTLQAPTSANLDLFKRFKNIEVLQKYAKGSKVEFGSGTTRFPRRISNAYTKETAKLLEQQQAEIAFERYPKSERIFTDEAQVTKGYEQPFDRATFLASFKDKIARDSVFQRMGQFAKFVGLPPDDILSAVPVQLDFDAPGGGVFGAGALFTKDPSGFATRGLQGIDLTPYGFSEKDKQDLYGYAKLIAEKDKEIAKVTKTPTQTFDDGSFSYDRELAAKLYEEKDILIKQQSEKVKQQNEAIKAAKEARKQSAEATGRGGISIMRNPFNTNARQTYEILYHELTHQLINSFRTKNAQSFEDYKSRVTQLFEGDNSDVADAFEILTKDKPGVYNSADIVYGRSYKNSGLTSVMLNKISRRNKSSDTDIDKNLLTEQIAEISRTSQASEKTKTARAYKLINDNVNGVLLKNDIGQDVIQRYEDNGKEEFLTTLIQNAPLLDSVLSQTLDTTLAGLFSSAGVQRFPKGGVVKQPVPDSVSATMIKDGKTLEEVILSELASLGGGVGVRAILGLPAGDTETKSVLNAGNIKAGKNIELAKNYINRALAARDTASAAEDARISKLTKVAVAGLLPMGKSDNLEWNLESGKVVYAYIRGVSSRYEKAIQQMQKETSESSQRFAENMQYTDIFTGDPLAFDFDETLVSGADILGPNGKPDIPKYSDEAAVREALGKGRLTLLGSKLKTLIDADPDFIKQTRILTARPQSTADLLAAKLQQLGLPYSSSDITGVSKGLGTDVAFEKAQNLGALEKLIDDNLDNVKAAQAAGKKAYLYSEPKTRPELDELIGQGNIEGAVTEKALALLGANLPPIESLEANRAVDFPYGLGDTAKFFENLDPNVPTEVKRTLNKDSFTKAREEFDRYFKENPAAFARGGAVRFALGGLADSTEAMSGLMRGLYGDRSKSTTPEQKSSKDKNFGTIGVTEDGGMISVGYYKGEERSGYVQAMKMRDNLWYVGLSKATKGYGPRLYDVAMEAVSEKGAMLTSDRSMVSKDAQNVWGYYFKNRGDVKKTPLDPKDWTKNQSLIDPKLYGRKETWPPPTDPAWILQSGYSKSPTLLNDPSQVKRTDNAKKKPVDSRSMALAYFQRADGGPISRFADGGSVPALVSNGEAYVPPKLAKRIGYGTLGKMNMADKNGMGRFSGGGVSIFKGPGTGTSDSIPTNLPVGSFIIREKATKALGLSKFMSGGRTWRNKTTGATTNTKPKGLWADEWEEIAQPSTTAPQTTLSAPSAPTSSSNISYGEKGSGTQPLMPDIGFLKKSAILLSDGFTNAEQLISKNYAAWQELDKVAPALAGALDKYLSATQNAGQNTEHSASLMIQSYRSVIMSLVKQGKSSAEIDAAMTHYIDALNQATQSVPVSDPIPSPATTTPLSPQIPTPPTPSPTPPPNTNTASRRSPPPVPKSAEQKLAAVENEAIARRIETKQNIESEYNPLYRATSSKEDKQAIQDDATSKFKAADATIQANKAAQQQAILQELLAQKAKEANQSTAEYIASLQEEIDARSIGIMEQDFSDVNGPEVPSTSEARQQALNETISSRGLQAFNSPGLGEGTDLNSVISQVSNASDAAAQADKAKADASIRATEGIELMRIKAEQNGQTLDQYQKSLRKNIIDLATDLQKALPEKISSFNESVGGLTNKIRGGKEDDVSDAKNILSEQLNKISANIDPKLLESTVDDLIESIQKGDNFVDIINSSENLQDIFKNAASDAGALDNALVNLSTATGLPIESLRDLATASDVTATNLLNKNLQSLDKFSSILSKGSLAVGAFTTGLANAIKMFGGENDKGSVVAAAGIEGFGSTVSTLGAGLSQLNGPVQTVLKNMSSMGGSMGSLAGKIGPALASPITAGVALVGVAVVGLAAALKDAHNAAREFDKALAAKNVENAMDKVANAFEDFSKDMKRLDLLDTIQQQLTTAGANVAEGIRIDAEVPKAMWVNLFDALLVGGNKAAERSMILEQKGIGAYFASIAGGDKTRNTYMQQMAPDMAKQQSAAYKPVADATLRLFEEKLKTGTSMEDVMKDLKDASGAPSQLAKNIAQSNPVIQEQILMIRASNNLSDDQKAAMEKNIIAQEAEYRARTHSEATLRSMEIDKLNREMKKFVSSLERMFNNMDSAINKTSYELDAMSRAAELSNAALSGNAKAGEVSIKSLNILANQNAYSDRDVGVAATQASEFFGSQSDIVKPLLTLGNQLESTALSTINKVIDENPEATNERIAAGIRSAMDANLRDLGLPENISDKISNQVKNAFQDISKSGTDAKDISFDEIVEQVPAFADSIRSASQAQELATKALEFYQKNLNDYAGAMNQMVDYQIEANSRFRRASDIQTQGLMKLNETFGKSASLFEKQQIINEQTRSLTGGPTNPAAIGQNILNLENTRSQLQGMSDSAANRGPGGRDEFMLMQNRLRNVNVSLRENYEALKQMADSTEMAEAAMNKIQEVQAKRQAGMNLLEKVVTSDPGEVAKLNNSIARLSNNMAGRTNLSTSEQRGEDLQTFNMIAPLLGEGQKQNELRANVLESMLKESGQGVNPLFAQVLDSLRNPEADPEMQEAIAYYKSSLAQQSQANMMLGQIQQLMAQNTAEVAAEKLAHSIQGVKLSFDNQMLSDINKGIWKLVDLANNGQPAPGMSLGGVVYASEGQQINFQSKGTDTVPAMLTPGEFVVNKKSTKNNLSLLKSINSGNYNKGGKVAYYADGGLVIDPRWTGEGDQKRDMAADFQQRGQENLVTSRRVPQLFGPYNNWNTETLFQYPNLFKAVSDTGGQIGKGVPYSESTQKAPQISRGNITMEPGVGYNKFIMNHPSAIKQRGAGATVAAVGALLGMAGLALSATVIGAPIGLPLLATGAIIGAIGGAVAYSSGRAGDWAPPMTQPLDVPNSSPVPLATIPTASTIKSLQKEEEVEIFNIPGLITNYRNMMDWYIASAKIDNLKERIQDSKNKTIPPNAQVTSETIGGKFILNKLTAIEDPKKGPIQRISGNTVPALAAGMGKAHVLGYAADQNKGGSYVTAGATDLLKNNPYLNDLVINYDSIQDPPGSPTSDLINRNVDFYNSIEDAHDYLVKAFENMRDKDQQDIVESKSSKKVKEYLSNLEALYRGNIFKAKFNKNLPFMKEGVDFPITLYNMKADKWKELLITHALLDRDGSYRNADDKNRFPNIERDFITINGKPFSWTSNMIDPRIFGASEGAFAASDMVKLVTRETKSYGDANSQFQFNYDQVKARFFDNVSRAFVGDEQEYVVVHPSKDINNKFPLSEALNNANVRLYAKNIDAIEAVLKAHTPLYDAVTGQEIGPSKEPFKYALDGMQVALTDSLTNEALESDLIKTMDAQDKNAIIQSINGNALLSGATLSAEAYRKKREEDIENARSLIAQARTATVDREKVTTDEAKFSEPIRLSIARAVQPLLSENIKKQAGINISATPPDEISQVGMIAGKLAQEATNINDVTSPRRAIIDAWRSLYVDLYKPTNPAQTAEYLKNLGIPVDRKLYGGEVKVNQGGLDKILYYNNPPAAIRDNILTAINREIALTRSKAFAGGDVDIGVSDTITDLAEGAILHDVDPKAGLKSGTNPKGKQPEYAGATTWQDVHKMALTPRNLFSESDTRSKIIDILKEYYTKASDKKGRKLYDKKYTDALDELQRWYREQDSFLNKSLSVEDIKKNMDSLKDQEIATNIDNQQKEATKAHLLLTGNIYGALPTSSKLMDLLQVRITEKEEELKEEAKQAGLPEGTRRRYAKGGYVPLYASSGTLVNFQPKGTDTVPAMLTPGEFVINKDSTQKYKPVLEAINSGNYNRGGIVNYLNKGGYIPQYKFLGGMMGNAQSFDFTKYLNGLVGSITSGITEALDKALSNLKQPNNAAGGVSNTSGDIASIDNFVNRLNNIANILSNIYIPPQITITGKHDVVVTINGDTVLNQLRPDIAGIVVSAIKGAFRDLKAKNPENNTINFNIDIDPRSLT